MTKLISILALMVITIPITVTLLWQGPDSIMAVSTRFFERLFAEAARFGM